jgi:hypothetical protein
MRLFSLPRDQQIFLEKQFSAAKCRDALQCVSFRYREINRFFRKTIFAQQNVETHCNASLFIFAHPVSVFMSQ